MYNYFTSSVVTALRGYDRLLVARPRSVQFDQLLYTDSYRFPYRSFIVRHIVITALACQLCDMNTQTALNTRHHFQPKLYLKFGIFCFNTIYLTPF